MDNQKTEFLLRLYDNTFKDESEHIQLEQKTLTLFSTLILAIIGGVLIVLKDMNEDIIKTTTLFVGGFLEIIISFITISAYKANYRRHLESIALRAKLEDLLNFQSEEYKGSLYWKEETLLLKRYEIDRGQYENSDEFVQDRVNKGFALVVKRVFTIISFIGLLFIGLGLYNLLK